MNGPCAHARFGRKEGETSISLLSFHLRLSLFRGMSRKLFPVGDYSLSQSIEEISASNE